MTEREFSNETPETVASPEADVEAPPPWEEIEPGRYQPKRTRGSCVGRELG